MFYSPFIVNDATLSIWILNKLNENKMIFDCSFLLFHSFSVFLIYICEACENTHIAKKEFTHPNPEHLFDSKFGSERRGMSTFTSPQFTFFCPLQNRVLEKRLTKLKILYSIFVQRRIGSPFFSPSKFKEEAR